MKTVLEMVEAAEVTATSAIQEGTPTAVILKVTRTRAADLIVLTARKQGIWSRLFFGARTNERVLEEADCHAIVLRDAQLLPPTV